MADQKVAKRVTQVEGQAEFPAVLKVAVKEAHGAIIAALGIVQSLRKEDSRQSVVTAHLGLLKAEQWAAELCGIKALPFPGREHADQVMATVDAVVDVAALLEVEDLVKTALRGMEAVKDKDARSEVLATRNGLLKAVKAMDEALKAHRKEKGEDAGGPEAPKARAPKAPKAPKAPRAPKAPAK